MIEVSNAALDTTLSSLELSIIADLQKVAQIVKSQGYECRAYSPKALVNLQALPTEKKEVLAKQLSLVLTVVNITSDVEIPADHHDERRYIEQAIGLYDLELRDEGFWKQLEKDDVIEVYSSENIQLFRTFNFFKISSYSLLDLLTNEWYVLWERPSFVLNACIEAAQSVLEGQTQKTTPINARRHILKEIYNDESIDFKCSSILVDPGVICPLYKKGSHHEVSGFLFSLRGKVMGYDADVDKIAII